MIDLDRVLARGGEANALARAMGERAFTWSAWLNERGIAPSDVAAYDLPCPQDPADAPIREALKDAHGRPYLPGSSIKGAIRTAILWRLMSDEPDRRQFAARYVLLCLKASEVLTALRERQAFDRPDEHRAVLARIFGVNEDEAEALRQTLYRVLNVEERRLAREAHAFRRRLEQLSRSREWLGQPVERAMLGRDPNHDLLRALQVSDSRPVGRDRLAIGLVWTYTLRGHRLIEKREQEGEYKIFVEWLRPETALAFDLRTDDFLFTERAEREIHFRGPREQALRELARTCNAYARAVIEAERGFFEQYDLRPIAEFYAELGAMLDGLSDGAFLLNIGWGGGWEVKTIGDLLRRVLSPEEFAELRRRYRLGEDPRTHRIDVNAPFPHTRRIGYEGGAPMYPLGWVRGEPGGDPG